LNGGFPPNLLNSDKGLTLPAFTDSLESGTSCLFTGLHRPPVLWGKGWGYSFPSGGTAARASLTLLL